MRGVKSERYVHEGLRGAAEKEVMREMSEGSWLALNPRSLKVMVK